MPPSLRALAAVRADGLGLGDGLRPIALGSSNAELADLDSGALPALVLGARGVHGNVLGYLALDETTAGGVVGTLELGAPRTLTHALLGARATTMQLRLLGRPEAGFHGVVATGAGQGEGYAHAFRTAIEPLEARNLIRVAYTVTGGLVDDGRVRDALVTGVTATALTLLDRAGPEDGVPRFAILEPTPLGREIGVALEHAGIEPVTDLAAERPQLLIADGPALLFDRFTRRAPRGILGVICIGPAAPTRTAELVLRDAGAMCIPRSVATAGALIADQLAALDTDTDSVLVRTARRQTQLLLMLIETAQRRGCSVCSIVREIAADSASTLRG